jgi:glycosyltransferase involved in cell wall biosynthesis
VKVAFFMDQIAGHVTRYQNLRRVIDDDPRIIATWHEIEFAKPDGRMERLASRLPFLPLYPIGVLRGTIEMRRALRSGVSDAHYSNSSVSVMCVGSLTKVPCVLDHDSTPLQIDRMPEYLSPRDPWPIAGLKYRMSRRLFRAVSYVETWSHWAKRSFVDDYGCIPTRIIVNPPGIPLDSWPVPDRSSRSGPVRVLFVGGDFERKGGNLLLDWQSRRDPGEVEVHVVTSYEVTERPGLRVHRGLRPNTPELLDRFAEADVFVLPSLAECFGIATVEAMASGLPVVASDSGGTADIVHDGGNGFIVRAGDQAALDAALDRLVADPSLRRTMGARSRAIAEQRFDLLQQARTTADLIIAAAGLRPRTTAEVTR